MRLKALWTLGSPIWGAHFVSPGSAKEEAEAGVEVTGSQGHGTPEDRHHKTQWEPPLPHSSLPGRGRKEWGDQGPGLQCPHGHRGAPEISVGVGTGEALGWQDTWMLR